MKTIGIFLALMFWAGIAGAQGITILDEARVGFVPISSEVKNGVDSYTFKVNESFHGEFERDPLVFMNEYFGINNFISEMKYRKFDSYEVVFRSNKGSFHAEFDQEGKLLKTAHKFQNIILPEELRHQLYRDHKGWAMTKNVHVAKGRNGTINKNFYRIKLENDGKIKRIKIDGKVSEEVELASK